MWRLVLAGIATLAEIDSHWTMVDVADANDLLDLREHVESMR